MVPGEMRLLVLPATLLGRAAPVSAPPASRSCDQSRCIRGTTACVHKSVQYDRGTLILRESALHIRTKGQRRGVPPSAVRGTLEPVASRAHPDAELALTCLGPTTSTATPLDVTPAA